MIRKDFSYECDSYGYMIFYKYQPIGGAGVAERKPQHWQHGRENTEDNRVHAENTIRNILDGNMGKGYQEAIDAIDN